MKLRLEGRKEHESELKLFSSPAAAASFDKQVTGQLLICLEKLEDKILLPFQLRCKPLAFR